MNESEPPPHLCTVAKILIALLSLLGTWQRTWVRKAGVAQYWYWPTGVGVSCPEIATLEFTLLVTA